MHLYNCTILVFIEIYYDSNNDKEKENMYKIQ